MVIFELPVHWVRMFGLNLKFQHCPSWQSIYSFQMLPKENFKIYSQIRFLYTLAGQNSTALTMMALQNDLVALDWRFGVFATSTLAYSRACHTFYVFMCMKRNSLFVSEQQLLLPWRIWSNSGVVSRPWNVLDKYFLVYSSFSLHDLLLDAFAPLRSVLYNGSVSPSVYMHEMPR